MNAPTLGVSARLDVRARLDVYARLLPLGASALDDAARAEVVDNPYLALGSERSTASLRDVGEERGAAGLPSLVEHLDAQLAAATCTAAVRRAADATIGSLDRDGYCRESVAALAAIARCSASDAERGLALVQTFEPLGVAARDLGERFALQLLHDARDDDARTICAHLDALAADGPATLATRLGIAPERVAAAVARLATLDARPTRGFDAPAAYVRPEFLIANDGGRWTARLDPALAPHVSFVPLESGGTLSSAMREARDRARRFVDALERRAQTLAALGERLVSHQQAFLDAAGDSAALAPLTGRTLARELGCADSTVSRALANRYARTPFGTVPLRAFIAAAPRAGSTLTTHEIVRRLGTIIAAERAPLSDRELARRLALDGIRVARRTVAKYRTALDIPSTRSRGDAR